MGIGKALAYGAVGGMIFGPTGALLGGLYAMFNPEAQDMNRAYDANRNTYTKSFGGFGMFDGLFGNTEGRPTDPTAIPKEKQWSDPWKVGAVAVGAMLLLRGGLGNFGLPLYAMGLAPYNLGGLIPQAWSSGLIPSWGWAAGII